MIERSESLRVRLNTFEKKMALHLADAEGFGHVSAWVRHLIRREAEKHRIRASRRRKQFLARQKEQSDPNA